MKKLTALIKPFKLEGVLEKLPAEGILEILCIEVRGYGRQKGHLELYKDREYEATFLPKLRLAIYCEDAVAEAVEQAIVTGARTGRIGDGKVFKLNVEHAQEC
jgi:nitrogen regulatory protein PII